MIEGFSGGSEVQERQKEGKKKPPEKKPKKETWDFGRTGRGAKFLATSHHSYPALFWLFFFYFSLPLLFMILPFVMGKAF